MFEKYKVQIIIGAILLISLGTIYGYIKTKEEEEYFVYDEDATTIEIKDFYVDVKGAVKNPGVYKFKNGDRVIDAIKIAGDINKNASTSNINLSKRLTPEMVVYVYTLKEIEASSKSLQCDTTCNCEVIEPNNCIEEEIKEGKININTASIKELTTLNSIGEAKAESIIKYREENGPFKNIIDIKNISGIGDKVYEQIKDKITI